MSINLDKDSTISSNSFHSKGIDCNNAQDRVMESLETILQSKRIRLVLLRHYPQKEWKDRWDNIIESFEELPLHIQEMMRGVFLNPTKTLVLTNLENGPQRVQKSVQNLKEVFQIQDNNIRNIQLKWTYESVDTRIQKRRESLTEFSELTYILQELEKSGMLTNIDTIVIVANRKYAVHFNTFIEGPKTISERFFEESLEQNGYALCDLPHNLRPIRNPRVPPLILPENYRFFQGYLGKTDNKMSCIVLEHDLCKLLEQEWEMERLFLKKETPNNVLLYCIQRFLWIYTASKLKWMFLSRFLETPIPESVLNVLCNHPTWRLLYKKLWMEIIHLNIQRSLIHHCRHDLLAEVNTIHSHLTSSLHRASGIFSLSLDESIRLLQDSKWSPEWSESDLVAHENSFDSSLENLPENSKETQPETRNYSNILINRPLFARRRRTQEEIRRLEEKIREQKQGRWGLIEQVGEFEDLPFSFEDMVLSEENTFVSLTWHVGEWKSTELARMFFLLQNDARFANTKSLFYNARELHTICKEDLAPNTPSTLEMIADRLTSDVNMLKEVLLDETIVVFFDGMDELPESIQKLIITTLTALSKKHSHLKIILGARPSASGITWNDNIRKIHFESIREDEQEAFIKSRIRAHLMRVLNKTGNSSGENGMMRDMSTQVNALYASVQKALDSGIVSEELKNTPLILFFLTELAIDGKLETIRNRADLYEKMVEKILFEHQGEKELPTQKRAWVSTFESIGAEMDARDKEMVFDVLGRCAFARFKNPNVLITREFIENILLEYRVKESRLQSVCDQIFLLYRAEGPVAGTDGESYAFILKSFEEFFLARHLAGLENGLGNEEIYALRDEATLNDETKRNWGDWRNFRGVVMFYGEILGNASMNEEWIVCDEDTFARFLSFLSKDGIRKNEDFFGEGFFITLETLLELPKNTREQKDILSIINELLTEMDGDQKIENGWTENMVIARYNTLARLFRKYNTVNQDENGEDDIAWRIELYLERFLGREDAHFFEIEYMKNSLSYAMGKLSSFELQKKHTQFDELCIKLLEKEYYPKEIFPIAVARLKRMLLDGDMDGYSSLCSALLQSEHNQEESFQLAKEGLEWMEIHWNWSQYNSLCFALLETNYRIDDTFKLAKEWLNWMMQCEAWHDYSALCVRSLGSKHNPIEAFEMSILWLLWIKKTTKGNGVGYSTICAALLRSKYNYEWALEHIQIWLKWMERSQRWNDYNEIGCAFLESGLNSNETFALIQEGLISMTEAWNGQSFKHYNMICSTFLAYWHDSKEVFRLAKTWLERIGKLGFWHQYVDLSAILIKNEYKREEAYNLICTGLESMKLCGAWREYCELCSILIESGWYSDEVIKLSKDGLEWAGKDNDWITYCKFVFTLTKSIKESEEFFTLIKQDLDGMKLCGAWREYCELCSILIESGWYSDEVIKLSKDGLNWMDSLDELSHEKYITFLLGDHRLDEIFLLSKTWGMIRWKMRDAWYGRFIQNLASKNTKLAVKIWINDSHVLSPDIQDRIYSSLSSQSYFVPSTFLFP